MKVEKLSLSHQALLQQRFDRLSVKLSDYSFANLYLFRHIHDYTVIQIDEEVFIQGRTRDQARFIMLTRPPSLAQLALLKTMKSQPFLLFPIPSEWLVKLPVLNVNAYHHEEDSDYLFTKNKLATYPGRHLSKKRNLVKQFLSHSTIQQHPLTSFNQQLALQLLEAWQDEQLTDKKETDYASCQEAILLVEQLHLTGILWVVNQQVAGLTIGELVRQDCFVLHFLKGLKHVPEFHQVIPQQLAMSLDADIQFKGLYQTIYQELALSLNATVEWINLEQDLGIEGLRQAKHSYLPDLLLPKWRIPFENNQEGSFENDPSIKN